jgi:hypothetical protein
MADDNNDPLDDFLSDGAGAPNLPDETTMEQMNLDQFNRWVERADRVWRKRNLPRVEEMPENLFRQYVQSQLRDPNSGIKD